MDFINYQLIYGAILDARTFYLSLERNSVQFPAHFGQLILGIWMIFVSKNLKFLSCLTSGQMHIAQVLIMHNAKILKISMAIK